MELLHVVDERYSDERIVIVLSFANPTLGLEKRVIPPEGVSDLSLRCVSYLLFHLVLPSHP